MENPPKSFFRLGPGKAVRLKYAFVIICDEVIKNSQGEVIELKCRYLKESFGGKRPEGMKKVKGIINWVCANTGVKIVTRLYDRLFSVPRPGLENSDFLKDLNPNSLKEYPSVLERSMENQDIGTRYQFERQGYFIKDQGGPELEAIYNRIITLRDTWAKIR